MTYETPFEKALLAEVRRTNDLLELLIMAHQPARYQIDDMSPEAQQRAKDYMTSAEHLTVEAAKGVIPAGSMMRSMMEAAGFSPMRRPRGDVPETPEQRAARFTARAKEVGMSDEEAAEVSGRIAVNLDQLVERPAATEDDRRHAQYGTIGVDEAPTPPAKRAPRKKAPGASG